MDRRNREDGWTRPIGLAVALLLLAPAACERRDELTDPAAYPAEGLPAFGSPEDFAEVRLPLEVVDPCPDGVTQDLTFDEPEQTFGLVVAYRAGMVATVEVAAEPAVGTAVAIYGPDDGTGYYGAEPMTGAGGSPGPVRMGADIAATGRYFVVVSTEDPTWVGGLSMHFGALGCGD